MFWLEIQEAFFKKGKYKMISSHDLPNYRIKTMYGMQFSSKERSTLGEEIFKIIMLYSGLPLRLKSQEPYHQYIYKLERTPTEM